MQNAEEPEAPEPGEPDRGVSTEAEVASRLRVLRPHRPQWAREVPKGGEFKFKFNIKIQIVKFKVNDWKDFDEAFETFQA